MMGIAQSDLSVPVVKATNSILCLLKDRNGAAENPVCLRCGKCVSVCPMHLQPLYMYRYVNAGRTDELERLNLMDCMGCGSCAFTCPGKLPLVESFRKGKQMIKEAVNAGRTDELERLNLMDCMGCGSCAFTCPGKLPLVESFRKGKQMIKEANSK